MNILIFGHGVTGTATGAVFSRANFTVKYVDPPKGETLDKLPDGFEPDYIFSCVPTPTDDFSYVIDVLDTSGIWDAPVVIRSTMPPGMVRQMSAGYAKDIILMPEFLREVYAVDDALKQDKCIYATINDSVAEDFGSFLMKAGYTTQRRVSLEACEIVKLALNSMLAVKVAFANVLFDVAKKNGANYDELVDLLVMDGWLSKFGLQVPGRHGRGFSGTCLPKDLGWLISYLHEEGIDGQDWLAYLKLYNERLLAMGSDEQREVLKEGV